MPGPYERNHGYAPRPGGGPGGPRGGGHAGPSPNVEVFFDPKASRVALLDELAEKQAKAFDRINSTQLRRFFGEVKELFRQFEALAAGRPDAEHGDIYRASIEPRFKMMRSKVAYATRAGGQSKLPGDFAKFVSDGVQKVSGHEEFRLFVQHFEAVVGFMYGLDKVRN